MNTITAIRIIQNKFSLLWKFNNNNLKKTRHFPNIFHLAFKIFRRSKLNMAEDTSAESLLERLRPLVVKPSDNVAPLRTLTSKLHIKLTGQGK